MDLTKTAQRSPNELMAGIVSLGRTLDKARAFAAGTLGEYHYDCPHDKPLFAFLGVDAERFSALAREAGEDDAAFERRVRTEFLDAKTPAEIQAFNAERRAWAPEPGTDSAAYFNGLREQVAPGRKDVTTWFALLDLDEGRPAPVAA